MPLDPSQEAIALAFLNALPPSTCTVCGHRGREALGVLAMARVAPGGRTNEMNLQDGYLSVRCPQCHNILLFDAGLISGLLPADRIVT